MIHLPPNGFRGAVGVIAFICVVSGAWMLWGIGAALFCGGLLLAIDTSSDEAVERFTRTTRYRPTTDMGGDDK